MVAARREYLDALIESYLAHFSRGGDVVRVEDGSYTYRATTHEYVEARAEVSRLCDVQRSMGLKDYFERQSA